MIRILLALLLAAVGWVCPAHALTPGQRVILLSQSGPSLGLDFLTMGGTLDSRISFSRASSATGALYTDAAGETVTTYSSGVARLTSRGFLVEQAATNYLLNSASPVTQTTGSLSTGSYVFFCNGSGSVTSSAGTATATGLGSQTCSDGTYQSLSVTAAGTLIFTVSGTVDWFDLQGQAFPTSHIVTSGSTATRAADVATVANSTFSLNASAGTLAIEEQTNGDMSGARVLGQIDDGSGINRYTVEMTSATAVQAREIISSTQKAILTGTITSGGVAKVALSYQSGLLSAALQGASLGTDSLTSLVAGIDSIAIGNSGGVFQPNSYIRSLRYWPKALSLGQLQALTQ